MFLRDDFLKMLEDDVLIGPIDHYPHSFFAIQVSGDSVIDDACPLIEEHRQVALGHAWLALPAGVSHSGSLQQFDAVGASDDQLAHMADIEDGCTAAAMQVLLDDSLRIVDWEVVACELHDFSLLRDVQLLEAGVLAS